MTESAFVTAGASAAGPVSPMPPGAGGRNVATYWANRESVVVGVNGQRLLDPSESGGAVPAVVVVMPSFAAHSLSHVLADWSAIGELMEAGRCGEELLVAMLHHAAEEAGGQEARRCSQPPCVPDGEEIELSVEGLPDCRALPRRVPGSIALPPTRLEPPAAERWSWP